MFAGKQSGRNRPAREQRFRHLDLAKLGPVVGQAALAFEVITGRVADVARMRDSFGEALA